MQNYFEIKQGGKTLRRRNTINDPFVFYEEQRVMCEYVYVKYGGGNCLYKTPALAGFNFDPDKGGLYACYETALGAEELNGCTIEAVGFAASQSTLQIVNTVAVNMVKTQGEPLYICGTMVLSATGKDFAFFGGDNKFVRMLLGTEAFSSAAMSITCGTDNTPMDGYTYAPAVLPSSVSPVFGSGEMSIGKIFNLPATDAVLLISGTPVMRIMAEAPDFVETKYLTAAQNDWVTVSVNDKVKTIEDLKVATLAVDFTAVRLPSALNYKKSAKIRFPNAAKIKRDAGGHYFAYVREGRAAIFALDGGEVKINRFFAAKDILIADDGAVFVVKEDGAVFFAEADEGGELLALNVTVGDKCAVAHKNGAYVLSTHKGGRAVFYKIVPPAGIGGLPAVSVLSDTASETTSADVHVFAMPSCVCVVAKATPALCFDSGGANAPKKAWLDLIVDASWFLTGAFAEYDAGRVIVYNPYIDQSAYYIDMKSTRYAPLGYGRFFGEFCVRNRTTGTVDMSAIGGLSPFASAAGKAVYAVTSGRFFYLFMEDGAVTAYYIASQSQKLYAGAITANVTVSYVQRSVNPPATGAIVVNIKSGG